MKSNRLTFSAFLALAAMLAVSPVDAQGNGNGRGNDKHKDKDNRPRQEIRREDDRWEDRRRDDERRRDDARRAEERRRDDARRYEERRSESTRFERREGRGVPRGWCQGRGNPHNTARNCGYRGSMDGIRRDRDGYLRDRLGRVIMGDGRVYDQRNGEYRRTGSTSRDRDVYRQGSYGGSSHSEYHAWHDQQCRDRAAQAGGVTGRLRVAAQCKSEHDAWHRQQGTSH